MFSKKKYKIFEKHLEEITVKILTIDRAFKKQPPAVFWKKKCSSKFSKIHRKHQCQSLCFNKKKRLKPATLLKKRHRHRCFPKNFAKFLGTPCSQNTFERLLLSFQTLETLIRLFRLF